MIGYPWMTSYTYLMHDPDTNLTKIGKSNSPKQRFNQIKKTVPNIELIKTFEFSSEFLALNYENLIQHKFDNKCKTHPNAKDGAYEFYELDLIGDIKFIETLYKYINMNTVIREKWSEKLLNEAGLHIEQKKLENYTSFYFKIKEVQKTYNKILSLTDNKDIQDIILFSKKSLDDLVNKAEVPSEIFDQQLLQKEKQQALVGSILNKGEQNVIQS